MGPEILAACRKAAEKSKDDETGVTSDAELTIEAIPDALTCIKQTQPDGPRQNRRAWHANCPH
jgi:hypothetical protein